MVAWQEEEIEKEKAVEAVEATLLCYPQMRQLHHCHHH
jgi:hypothetical protein